jgi:hypothetical protein
MSSPEYEFDPDDNYAGHGDDGAEIDDEAAFEALVWQLLLLINPDDEEGALQQFGEWQEMLAAADPEDADPFHALRMAIDWKSGFHVGEGDTAALVECIDELAARWNLRIDWGVDDADDDGLVHDADAATLIAVAHGRMREDGYTLWTWNPRGEASEETHAGFVSLRRDDEAMEALALALGIEVRPGRAH